MAKCNFQQSEIHGISLNFQGPLIKLGNAIAFLVRMCVWQEIRISCRWRRSRVVTLRGARFRNGSNSTSSHLVTMTSAELGIALHATKRAKQSLNNCMATLITFLLSDMRFLNANPLAAHVMFELACQFLALMAVVSINNVDVM